MTHTLKYCLFGGLLLAIPLMAPFTALSQNQNPKTGAFVTSLKEYHPESMLGKIYARIDGGNMPAGPQKRTYNIQQETYYVYVPQGYSPKESYGILVWINAGDQGNIPTTWAPLMDKLKLIWIGANNSGNKHDVLARRMPLALDAVHNITRAYNIDPDRIYISGMSGGGRTASITSMHYPDVFKGAIFVTGACYWNWQQMPRNVKVKSQMPKPNDRYIAMAKNTGRYVFLTGDNDFNRDEMRSYYQYGYSKMLDKTHYIQVPGMGHSLPPANWYYKALLYLDNNKPAKKAPSPQAPKPPAASPAKPVDKNLGRGVREWLLMGNVKIKASLVEVKPPHAILKKTDNTTLKVSVVNLSEEDRKYIQSLSDDSDQ